MRYTLSLITLVGACILLAAPAQAVFEINLVYRDPVAPTPAELAAFEGAKSLWENIISGYIDDNNMAAGAPVDFRGPTIDVYIRTGDGPLGNLGTARPISTRRLGVGDNSFVYALTGRMDFDSDDFGTDAGFSADVLERIVAHEMGHVLGVGTLWDDNGIYSTSTALRGKYRGEYGIAAYNWEFGQQAEFIPVELGGGSGTAHFHWDEPDNGAAFTGLLDRQGRDLTYELMTGWLNHRLYLPFISQTTAHSMRDIGYTLTPWAVPEPSTGVAAVLALVGVGWIVRRRRATHFQRIGIEYNGINPASPS